MTSVRRTRRWSGRGLSLRSAKSLYDNAQTSGQVVLLLKAWPRHSTPLLVAHKNPNLTDGGDSGNVES